MSALILTDVFSPDSFLWMQLTRGFYQTKKDG
jgi:hypothetical protein